MTVLGIGGLVASSLLTASAGMRSTSVVSQPRLTTSQDVARQTSSTVLLRATGGVSTSVISGTVSAGSRMLAAGATLVSGETSDYTRCSLYAGETVVGRAAAMIGNNTTAGSGPRSHDQRPGCPLRRWPRDCQPALRTRHHPQPGPVRGPAGDSVHLPERQPRPGGQAVRAGTYSVERPRRLRVASA